MNETAKKLRDITQNAGVTPGSGNPYSVIATIKSAFGFDSILAAGVLLQFMAAIADELDELQARAAGANNLRQQLESAEKKAERRKKQVEHTEDAIRERNARLKMRAELLEQAVNENRELRKQMPSERERAILDMWPKFEDGEYVWFGDAYVDGSGDANKVRGVRFNDRHVFLVGIDDFLTVFNIVECAKRPAPKVLDAGGVEIKVGDTVYEVGTGREFNVERLPNPHACQGVMLRHPNGGSTSLDAPRLTHTRPDSWERLEMDAELNDETGIVGGNLDIVRRAKALAGVEVD